MAKISSSGFGFIVIDGKQYVHDVQILPDGTVKEREASKSRAGSHTVTRTELENIKPTQPDVVVIGTGVSGLVRLAGDIEVYQKRAKLNLMLLATPQAVTEFNRLTGEGKKVAALIHVTC
ncbi:MAG: hypothetical protein HY670_06940 [Chloroflexi bacterium]|nr:hypothetical protein [Chloroflexota bacterium]